MSNIYTYEPTHVRRVTYESESGYIHESFEVYFDLEPDYEYILGTGDTILEALKNASMDKYKGDN